MGARKRVNMEQIEITNIIDRIGKGKASASDLEKVRSGLKLLKIAQETLIDGEEVQKRDLAIIGSEVGGRLRAAREKLGFSQEKLESLSKVSQSTISKIESGSRMISNGEAKSLAKVLDVTPQFLIAGD
jgi:ribosome-binding protein aMBF1 (putative translation factor)